MQRVGKTDTSLGPSPSRIPVPVGRAANAFTPRRGGLLTAGSPLNAGKNRPPSPSTPRRPASRTGVADANSQPRKVSRFFHNQQPIFETRSNQDAALAQVGTPPSACPTICTDRPHCKEHPSAVQADTQGPTFSLTSSLSPGEGGSRTTPQISPNRTTEGSQGLAYDDPPPMKVQSESLTQEVDSTKTIRTPLSLPGDFSGTSNDNRPEGRAPNLAVDYTHLSANNLQKVLKDALVQDERQPGATTRSALHADTETSANLSSGNELPHASSTPIATDAEAPRESRLATQSMPTKTAEAATEVEYTLVAGPRTVIAAVEVSAEPREEVTLKGCDEEIFQMIAQSALIPSDDKSSVSAHDPKSLSGKSFYGKSLGNGKDRAVEARLDNDEPLNEQDKGKTLDGSWGLAARNLLHCRKRLGRMPVNADKAYRQKHSSDEDEQNVSDELHNSDEELDLIQNILLEPRWEGKRLDEELKGTELRGEELDEEGLRGKGLNNGILDEVMLDEGVVNEKGLDEEQVREGHALEEDPHEKYLHEEKLYDEELPEEELHDEEPHGENLHGEYPHEDRLRQGVPPEEDSREQYVHEENLHEEDPRSEGLHEELDEGSPHQKDLHEGYRHEQDLDEKAFDEKDDLIDFTAGEEPVTEVTCIDEGSVYDLIDFTAGEEPVTEVTCIDEGSVDELIDFTAGEETVTEVTCINEGSVNDDVTDVGSVTEESVYKTSVHDKSAREESVDAESIGPGTVDTEGIVAESVDAESVGPENSDTERPDDKSPNEANRSGASGNTKTPVADTLSSLGFKQESLAQESLGREATNETRVRREISAEKITTEETTLEETTLEETTPEASVRRGPVDDETFAEERIIEKISACQELNDDETTVGDTTAGKTILEKNGVGSEISEHETTVGETTIRQEVNDEETTSKDTMAETGDKKPIANQGSANGESLSSGGKKEDLMELLRFLEIERDRQRARLEKTRLRLLKPMEACSDTTSSDSSESCYEDVPSGACPDHPGDICAENSCTRPTGGPRGNVGDAKVRLTGEAETDRWIQRVANRHQELLDSVFTAAILCALVLILYAVKQ